MRFCCYLQYFSKVGPLRKVSFWGPFLVPFWDPKWPKRGPKWHLKNSSKNRSIFGPFGGPFWDPLGTPGEKNRGHFLGSCPNGPPGGPKGHFGTDFGPILESFWSHFGVIFGTFLINFRCHMEQCGGLRAEYFRRDIGLFFLV